MDRTPATIQEIDIFDISVGREGQVQAQLPGSTSAIFCPPEVVSQASSRSYHRRGECTVSPTRRSPGLLQ